jgi:predicted esterase YcpF (UPF0227 family)
MKVYFSHGKESGPWGSKIKRLAEIVQSHGCEVDSIDYQSIPDPDLRVEHLVSALSQEQDDFLLVGSSMGGYVSLVAAEQVKAKGVFLLAPALYIDGYKQQTYKTDQANLEIVHGWSDIVIPPEHSIAYAKEAHCTLHLIDGDHRLNSSIDNVSALFERFILNVLS